MENVYNQRYFVKRDQQSGGNLEGGMGGRDMEERFWGREVCTTV